MNFEFIASMLPAMLPAVKNTLIITVFSAFFGWIFGIVIALIRINRIKGLSRLFAVYVSFMRSVPLVIIMFFYLLCHPYVHRLLSLRAWTFRSLCGGK